MGFESLKAIDIFRRRARLGRWGWPEDCAKVVEFLITDLSDYVTGQVISVCGGYILF